MVTKMWTTGDTCWRIAAITKNADIQYARKLITTFCRFKNRGTLPAIFLEATFVL